MKPLPAAGDRPIAELLAQALEPVRTEPVRRAIEHYFAGLGGGGPTPRQAIDPAQLRDALPNVILLDVQDDAYPVRLAGTEYRHRLGREITGTNWLALVPTQCRVAMLACLRRLMTQPCGVHFLIGEGWRSGPSLEYVLLPVANAEQGASDQLFGAAAVIREVDHQISSTLVPALATRFIDIGWSVPAARQG